MRNDYKVPVRVITRSEEKGLMRNLRSITGFILVLPIDLIGLIFPKKSRKLVDILFSLLEFIVWFVCGFVVVCIFYYIFYLIDVILA